MLPPCAKKIYLKNVGSSEKDPGFARKVKSFHFDKLKIVDEF